MLQINKRRIEAKIEKSNEKKLAVKQLSFADYDVRWTLEKFYLDNAKQLVTIWKAI